MKTFNKAISLVTAIVFVFSMMAIPVFAAGRGDWPEADGNEKLVVTYYSDDALTTPVTSVEAGSTVYAKISLNIPSKTLLSLDVNLSVENAEIEGETSKFALDGLARRTDSPAANSIASDKKSANIYIALADESSYNSPTNYEDYGLSYPVYMDLGSISSFDITAYKLKVGSSGKVLFKNAGEAAGFGVGLQIGVPDMETGLLLTTPFTVEDAGLTIASAAPVKTVAFDAEWKNSSLTYDSTLDDDALKANVKANIKVTKVVTTDGVPAAAEEVTEGWDVAVDKANKKATVTFPATASEGSITSATTKDLTFDFTPIATTYTLKAVNFNGTEATSAIDADYVTYNAEAALKAAFTVVMNATTGSSTVDENAVADTDYVVNVTKSTTANTATVNVTFPASGKLSGTSAKEYTVTFTDVPVEWSNVVAEFTTSTFANNTAAADVKAAVEVTATKTVGVNVTDDVSLTLDTDYTVTIDGNPANVTADGFVTVALIGDLAGKALTPADGKLTFTVTPATITYKNYAMSFEDDVKVFDATVTDDAIKAKIKVTADRYADDVLTVTGEEIASSNYDITIDRATGEVKVTFKGTTHGAAAELTDTITLNDVIEMRNITAAMSTRMFAAGTAEDTIKAAVSVKADKYVNNVLDTENVDLDTADYTVTVDTTAKTVTVEYAAKYSKANDVFTIAIGVNANAAITLGGGTVEGSVYKVEKGTDLTATINIEGLGSSDKIYGAELTFSTDKGTIKAQTIGTGYGLVGTAPAYPSVSATVKLAKDTTDNATKTLITFTIDTSALNDGDVITVKTESLKLSTVDGGDIAELPSFAGEEKTATVSEVVVPTTADISASFNIKTLGDIASAAARFTGAMTVTNKDTGAAVDATGKISLDAANKKVELKDLTVGAGTYTVKVAVPGYTTAQVDIVVAYDEASNTMKVTGGTTGAESIYAGDVSGNNVIDADDYATLVGAFGTAVSGNEKFDLYVADSDSTINLNDIITMVYEFEQYALATITSAGIIE